MGWPAAARSTNFIIRKGSLRVLLIRLVMVGGAQKKKLRSKSCERSASLVLQKELPA